MSFLTNSIDIIKTRGQWATSFTFKSMKTFERSYDNKYIFYKIGPVVQKEKILNLVNVFLQFFYNYLPSKKV